MRLDIFYDSIGLPGYKTGWGFSCLVSTHEGKVLFDCGWDADILLKNLEKMGTKPHTIKTVVISHSHWDHLGGLAGFLSARSKVATDKCTVFVPRSFSPPLKHEISRRVRLREVGPRSVQVIPRLTLTQEMGEDIKEIALIGETKKGSVVVSGCMHQANRFLPLLISKDIYLMIGGFHDVKVDAFPMPHTYLVAPCHCTKERQAMRGAFGIRYLTLGVGNYLEIGESKIKPRKRRISS